MPKVERGEPFKVTRRRVNVYSIPVMFPKEWPGDEYQGPPARADLAVSRDDDGELQFLGDFIRLRGTLGELWQYEQDTFDFIARYYKALEQEKK